MQIIPLVIPAFTAYYWKEKKDDRAVQNYAYPLYLAGSCVLFVGIALCSHIVETTTVEQTFKSKSPYVVKTIFQLQMACEMGDQNFHSHGIIKDTKDCQVRTSKISSTRTVSSSQQIFDARRNKVTWLAVSLSLSGFVCQFVGLRALHWSATITQLGVTLVMTAIRARVRRGISFKPRAIRLPETDLHQLALSLGHACLSDWPKNLEVWPEGDRHSLNLVHGALEGFETRPRKLTQSIRRTNLTAISLQDPRISLELTLTKFTPPGHVHTDATSSSCLIYLIRKFLLEVGDLNIFHRVQQSYRWQHLIRITPALNLDLPYSRLCLSLHLDDKDRVIWDECKG